MNRTLRLVLISLTGLCPGCCHFSASHHRAAAPPLPAEMAAQFDYPKTNKLAWRERMLSTTRQYTVKRIELPSVIHLAGTNKTITLDCYQPIGRDKVPVILVLPIAGGGYEVEEHFAGYFARRGLASVIVHREKLKGTPEDAELFNDLFRQTVLDNKQAIDWLETQPEFDPTRIGVFGTSLGGIKGALLTPLDGRVKAAVLGLTGGDLPYLLTYTTEPGVTRRRTAWLREQGLSQAELREKLKGKMNCDPMNFAPYVDPAKVLLVLAACDTCVPINKGLELRDKMGKPETVFVFSGHYTSLLYLPYIQWHALRFFQKKFN